MSRITIQDGLITTRNQSYLQPGSPRRGGLGRPWKQRHMFASASLTRSSSIGHEGFLDSGFKHQKFWVSGFLLEVLRFTVQGLRFDT